MVNKASRTEDIQEVYTFRFLIHDLSSTLLCEYEKKRKEKTEALTMVYRGVQMTMNEVEQLISNERTLVSINGYLSGSRLRQIAVSFAMKNDERMDSIPVLFEIQCSNEEENGAIFADIAKFSDFPDEQEILFDLGAVFRVEKLCQSEAIRIVHLTATGEGREIAREYIEETKKEMEGYCITIFFGSLWIRMGRYEQAETYFQQLLIDPRHENLAHIHNQLGLVYLAKAEFYQAMKHFEIAYPLMSQLRDSGHVLRNISHVLIEEGYYEKALTYCKKAIEILEDYQLERAHCLHSTGLCYLGLRKYDEALEYYEQALSLKRNCLPENHIHIAETLNSIGLVYRMTNDIDKAFSYYCLSLEIYQLCLPEDHSDIANVLHNIADYSFHGHQYDKALQQYHRVLTMKEKCFPSGCHPAIAATLNNISRVLSCKGEKEKALQWCLKALKMREKILPFDHLDVALSLSSVGYKYEALNKNQLALSYFEKASEIRVKFLPRDDPIRKKAERDVLRMKRKLM